MEQTGARYGSTIRSFNGCWTCRLRRKKCDERRPVCDACATLFITCYYDSEKPDWMDGGSKQEEMTKQIKREVKENAHRRRGERMVQISDDHIPSIEAAEIHTTGIEPFLEASHLRPQRGADCTLISKDVRGSVPFGRSDTILLMFYLEHLLPFLFPFYRPSLLQGGRAWVLEMMISSPVVRQATLCQSSYFFSLARGATHSNNAWEVVLCQTQDAFEVLRQSLQVIDGPSIAEHLHGAVRILSSIIQMQRFEVAILSFNNCQAHLNAAIALFAQLLQVTGPVEPANASSSFNAFVNLLGPTSWVLPTQDFQVPSAEQAAFRFSSALLILDDIIASTVLQEEPKLYEYHSSLLGDTDGMDPAINLEATIGCQNWVLLQLSEISVLDAWKQRSKRAGDLDVIGLVHRATIIKNTLETRLTQLESDLRDTPKEDNGLLGILTADNFQTQKISDIQTSLVTRVWAHAALLYLSVVVSGWQPANVEVRYHVGRIIDLLTYQISPPSLLRTVAWPFCLAGCLAIPVQEAPLRSLVEALQPPSVFGSVRKALEIMEEAWRNRDMEDSESRDLSACFGSQGNLVLLV
ncbi:fungal-specific transcription factor domain-containing protein [Hypoxylon trugodes]|uniref:fungal-specific transcription factor domain-containing protein n=1 Tax=Hypoxylon trugodes TaxID=326681 RepID=UPI0021945A3D|nr:fungal-specific transcription factor domain-containing protein [Hypoxylon trugodes]KAI1387684.1 fungal-specific transcription factor domain-containing protein [Hypoxylon trugodes]